MSSQYQPPLRQERHNDTTPDEPQVAPTSGGLYGMSTHDMTLHTLMQLQRTVGSLEGTVSNLSKAIDSQSAAAKSESTGSAARLDLIDTKISGITHKMYAASVVLTITIVIGGWAVNKTWDLVSAIAVPVLQETVRPTAAPNRPLSAEAEAAK